MSAPRADPPAEANPTPTVANARAPSAAGARLRAAREAMGLSVDAVAQQLKLAPRQVKALEDDDWQRLPGRTFVRGFARNYARFVQIDPETVLALLPAPESAPALERPGLGPSRRPMGEIPVERVAKRSAARWLVPLLVLAIVGGIAYFELPRASFHLPALLSSLTQTKHDDAATAPEPVAPGPATPSEASPSVNATSAASTGAVTVLPTPSTADPTPAAATTPAPSAAVAAGAGATGSAPAETSLVLTFKGTSWAEVKDAKGRVVLQITGGAGMTQTISGVPPLELSLGNARDVDVTFRGQALDLTPYTRGNVAHVSLQ